MAIPAIFLIDGVASPTCGCVVVYATLGEASRRGATALACADRGGRLVPIAQKDATTTSSHVAGPGKRKCSKSAPHHCHENLLFRFASSNGCAHLIRSDYFRRFCYWRNPRLLRPTLTMLTKKIIAYGDLKYRECRLSTACVRSLHSAWGQLLGAAGDWSRPARHFSPHGTMHLAAAGPWSIFSTEPFGGLCGFRRPYRCSVERPGCNGQDFGVRAPACLPVTVPMRPRT
jgi:hypothetical protein